MTEEQLQKGKELKELLKNIQEITEKAQDMCLGYDKRADTYVLDNSSHKPEVRKVFIIALQVAKTLLLSELEKLRIETEKEFNNL